MRMGGYMLTADVSEDTFFNFYGPGGNGKGLFVNTLTGILGKDYCYTLPMEALLETYTDRHPAELTGLRGARVAAAAEPSANRSWNLSRLKQFTGRNNITARYMRGDPFEFAPTFKLLVAANNKIRLPEVGAAERRRWCLVPWSVVIPKAEQDKQLEDKLRAEWPGILHQLIRGCLEWQAIGLAPPAVVTEATEEYLNEQDTVLEFAEAYLIVEKTAEAPAGETFRRWKEFKDARNEKPGTQTQFAERMAKMGFSKKRDNQGQFFHGFKLKPTLMEQRNEMSQEDIDRAKKESRF
jgi:putative DNA primase/helicase